MVRPENELVCPDSSGHTKKGLGNNLAWKCLAGMPQFLNPANFFFSSSV